MGVPQPRWIGSKYWQVPCRILLVLINPGQSIDEEWNQSEAKVFSQFHNGGRYDCLRTHFRQCALKGGSQHTWLCRYRDLLTWDIEEIAQINMAWCATVDNRHPHGMLEECFKRHTACLLGALEPHVVLLSGKVDFRDFKRKIETLRPGLAVRVISHYARNALSAEEAREVRQWLLKYSARFASTAQHDVGRDSEERWLT